MATIRRQDRKNKYFGDWCEPSCAHEDACQKQTLLPPEIVRVSDEAIASRRLVGEVSSERPVTVAAFDFDGTCIDGSSPKTLVSQLSKRNLISLRKLFRVACWGAAYKLNLPKDAEGVRTRVFSAFKGFSAVKVNNYLLHFYREKIASMYRADADAAMIAHLEAGHVVVLVSASFEPIIAAAMVEHPIQFALASRMRIDEDGNYTDEVLGLPTEGPEKIVVLREFLDKRFGKEGWTLGWAYGDHYSDKTLLEAASHPCAVTPDGKLRRLAEESGWDVLDWA